VLRYGIQGPNLAVCSTWQACKGCKRGVATDSIVRGPPRRHQSIQCRCGSYFPRRAQTNSPHLITTWKHPVPAIGDPLREGRRAGGEGTTAGGPFEQEWKVRLCCHGEITPFAGHSRAQRPAPSSQRCPAPVLLPRPPPPIQSANTLQLPHGDLMQY